MANTKLKKNITFFTYLLIDFNLIIKGKKIKKIKKKICLVGNQVLLNNNLE
jgi:hypothetical protein